MCLDTGRPLKRNEKKPKFGYKVFDFQAEKYEFIHLQYHDTYRVPVGKWLTAELTVIGFDNDSRDYTAGFHVYQTRKDAETDYVMGHDRKVVRVQIAEVHTVGKQNKYRIYVANKMFVPKPKEKKRKKVCA